MGVIFEVNDKTGRRIRLTQERWTHITSPQNLHPYVVNYLERIKQALIQPDIIVPQKFDDTKANYYLFIKERKHYLLVAVRYLNGDGYVTTAFITPHVRKR